MTVVDLMTREVQILSPDQTLRDAVVLMRRHKVHQLPVVDSDKVVGIVTDRDVKRATPSALSEGGREDYDRVLNETTVAQVMTRDPVIVTESTPVKEAVRLLLDGRFGALPVVNDGRLIGIVTYNDFLRAYYESLP